MGPSGSGKTTLLHIMGTLLSADSGTYMYKGTNIFELDNQKQAAFRNSEVGIVVQNYALLEHETVYENVALPFRYSKKHFSKASKRESIMQALEKVNMAAREKSEVAVLSGGEHQRVAIARALVMCPELILADEPTGALDTENGKTVMKLLLALVPEGKTLVLVTHNEQLAALCDRQVSLVDGELLE